MVTEVGLMFITCNKMSVLLVSGLKEQATQMCVGLCANGSTSAQVAVQGGLSFPTINCTVRPGIVMFVGAETVKSSVMVLVDGTCCSEWVPWVTGIVYW